MAIGKASDFVIYQDQFYGGMYERIVQSVAHFNAASRNAIRLVARDHRGDWTQESFLKDIAMITRRDTTSTSTVTDTAMAQGEIVKVKLNRKIGPIAQTLDAWRKISSDAREMSFKLGAMVGERQMQGYLNDALTAGVQAIKNVSSNTYGGTGSTMTTDKFVKGLAKLGDQANRVIAWVMHSKPYFDLVSQQIASAPFEIGGIVVRDGTPVTLNRPVIVTDSASLLTTGIPDTYHVLGLVEDAIVVEESEEQELTEQVITGLENLVFRVQGEYAFTLGVKGFKWDYTNGGANPSAGALGTGSNWDIAVTANKDLAGVAINTD